VARDALIVLEGLRLAVFGDINDGLDDELPKGDRPDEEFGSFGLSTS